MDALNEILGDIDIPPMVKICRKFSNEKLTDIHTKLESELSREKIDQLIVPGMRIAITAGSRGIDNIALILKETVRILRLKGAQPFLTAAMGSHGGATAQGQRDILTGIGITEEYCDCKIISSMEVACIGTTDEGQPVYIDKAAAEADATIVVNRIKAHTGFHGTYESGLMKMMAIGLAKREGAAVCHNAGIENMDRMVPLFGKAILKNANVIFGIAILENAYDKTYDIKALDCEEIITEEPKLLVRAKELMPKFPFNSADVLIVGEIGKDISGDGMDPNITGKCCTGKRFADFSVQSIGVLRLSKKTYGSAVGLGLADVTTKAVFDGMDRDVTYSNALTSLVPAVAKIPAVMGSDEQCIAAAIKFATGRKQNLLRMVMIKNTLCMSEYYVSQSIADEISGNEGISVLSDPARLTFDSNRNLNYGRLWK